MALDLAGWLQRIEQLHPNTIELGLERVGQVRRALSGNLRCPVITVGGTNGKGSTCAMLEAILLAAGYRTGLYTSPHLLRYNERVRVCGREAGDDELTQAFASVDSARGAVALTYFEFGTLAAWDLFCRSELDVVILEVGLGGRLDAVNLFDADCAILTSVDLDHMDWLGDTREKIGLEKAHIFRPGRPAICADPLPPQSVLDYAAGVGADLQLISRDFGYQGDQQQWGYWGRSGKRAGLAYPALRGANQLLNASAALAALDALRDRLPVGMNDVRKGLSLVELPGRFQVMPGRPVVVLDVGHNPHAAAVLANNLSNMGFANNTIAVFGMLRDKDIAGVVAKVAGRIDRWHVATLDSPRGTSAGDIARVLALAGVTVPVLQFDSPHEAYASALVDAGENDRIVVFGSFLTVSDVLAARAAEPAQAHV
jgi:dihydrofolate synthase/folylpolyglutamate synthase